jgi:hypothetical protein
MLMVVYGNPENAVAASLLFGFHLVSPMFHSVAPIVFLSPGYSGDDSERPTQKRVEFEQTQNCNLAFLIPYL